MSNKLPDIIKKRQQIGDYAFFTALAIAGTGILYKMMPYINNLLGMLQTGLMRTLAIGAMLTVGAVFVTNIRSFLKLGRVASRALTRLFVSIDPIGFMEELMVTIEERKVRATAKIATLKAAKQQVKKEHDQLIYAIEDIKAKSRVVDNVKQAEFLGRDLQRKERSLRDVENKLALFERYDTALADIREMTDIRLMDLRSELDEARRSHRVSKSANGLADDIRSLMGSGEDSMEWNSALTQVNTELDEMYANLDLLFEDMAATINNNKLDGSVAVERITELRKAHKPRVEAPSEEEEEEYVPAIDLSAIKINK